MPFRRRPRWNKTLAVAGARQTRACVVGHRRRIDPEQTHPASSHRRLRGESRIPSAGHRAYGEEPVLYIEDPEPDRMAQKKFEGPALRSSQPVSAEKRLGTASLA